MILPSHILLQGTRLLNSNQPSEGPYGNEKVDFPSLSLFQDELEGEDYIFRTNLDGMEQN